MPELEFEVDDAEMFRRSIETIQKIIDEGCFEPFEDGRGVMLRSIDPSHIATANLEISELDLTEWQTGDKFCLSLEKLTKVLGRLRKEDERVKLSVEGEKVVVEFPQTSREFTIPKLEIEPYEFPKPALRFEARAGVATKELKPVLKDIEGMGCYDLTLDAPSEDELLATCTHDDERYVKRFRRGDVGLVRYEVEKPSKSMFNLTYFDKLTTTAFDIVDLRWGKDIPISMNYELSPHSRLEFLLAPRVE